MKIPLISSFKTKFLLFSILSLLFAFLASNYQLCYAQELETKNTTSQKQTKRINHFVLDLHLDRWCNLPQDIKQNFWSPGINFYWMRDFALSQHLTMGIGFGVSSYNIHYNGSIIIKTDSISFHSYSQVIPQNNSNDYIKNKLSTNFLDIPFELGYSTKQDSLGNSFHISVGASVGYLINVHSKTVYSGLKEKTYFFPNVNPIRYGISTRIGYGIINLMASYNLSGLFKKDKGDKLIPYSFGISLMP